MILEARRLSQAYLMNNVSFGSGDPNGGCSTTTTGQIKLPGATLYPSGVLFDTGLLCTLNAYISVIFYHNILSIYY